jgi:hypothetical protein
MLLTGLRAERVRIDNGRAQGLDAVTKSGRRVRVSAKAVILAGGAVPTPMFDTQIAAMVAGYGDQASYDSLARGLAGAAIDKAHRFSDWSARPLSEAQVDYAAADVTHLRVIYQKLVEQLSREGRLDWVAAEMAALQDPAGYIQAPETAWEKLRPRTGNRRFLSILRAVAAWREREAQRINIPRQRLVKDETLLEIAATTHSNAAELARAAHPVAEGRQGLEGGAHHRREHLEWMGYRIHTCGKVGRIHGCGVPDHQAVQQEAARVADQQITGAGPHEHVGGHIGLEHQALHLADNEHSDEQGPEQQMDQAEMLRQAGKVHHAHQPDQLEDDRARAKPIQPALVGAHR